jgi:dTDP-4-dehydrorhamnose 3,5-epimerase
MVIVPPGVIHAYRNIGTENGIVFNAPNRLYGGAGRKSPVDEIRHEDEAASPYCLD